MLRLTCRNVASAAAFSLIFAVLMLYSSSCRVSAPVRLFVREFFPPQNISNSQVHLVPVARLPENTPNQLFQFRVAPGAILLVARNWWRCREAAAHHRDSNHDHQLREDGRLRCLQPGGGVSPGDC